MLSNSFFVCNLGADEIGKYLFWQLQETKTIPPNMVEQATSKQSDMMGCYSVASSIFL